MRSPPCVLGSPGAGPPEHVLLTRVGWLVQLEEVCHVSERRSQRQGAGILRGNDARTAVEKARDIRGSHSGFLAELQAAYTRPRISRSSPGGQR